jgi:peptidoglycan/LPS O-acetylase OafA/YrhL
MITSPPRYESLDLWRGLACLMVVVVHAGQIAKDRLTPEATTDHPFGARLLTETGRLGVGVQIFFVISGYCIAATAAASRRKPTNSVQFLLRRFRRIFPPYWAALLVTITVAWMAPRLGLAGTLSGPHAGGGPLIPHPGELTPLQWLGNLTLTEHWRWHLGGDLELKLHGPAWTLCYEEQFYATCGLLLLCARRWFFTAVAVTTAVVTALALSAHAGGWQPPVGFFFDGTWLLFAAGVAVYWHRLQAGAWQCAVPVLFAWVALFLGWYRYGFLAESVDRGVKQQAFEWVAGAGFGLTLIALLPVDHWLAGSRVLLPITRCGKICYSLYLIHWPVGLLVSALLDHAGVRGVWPSLLVTIPVAGLVSVAASAGFYWLVERHFLNSPTPQQALALPTEQTAPNAVLHSPAPSAAETQPELSAR